MLLLSLSLSEGRRDSWPGGRKQARPVKGDRKDPKRTKQKEADGRK